MNTHNKNNLKIAITILSLTLLAIIISNCSQKLESYHQAIEPPVVTSDLPFQEVEFNADSTTFIESVTGSQIKIPAGTFITKSGQKVKGNVSIKYREFHNAMDILRSGIPMSTNQDRTNFLQSAGMIELRAYQNNQELAIDKNKNIEIELASFKPSDGYSLYCFDEKNQWVTTDTFKTQNNTRKQSKLSLLSKLPAKPNEDSSQDIVFELATNLTESPYLKPFKDIEWRIDANEVTQKIKQGMRVIWDEVAVKEINHRKMRYELMFTKKMDLPYSATGTQTEVKSNLLVYATPLMHHSNRRQNRKAFALQMEEYKKILAKIDEEKARVLKEADLVNTFKINKMGIWNIDRLQKTDNIIYTKINFDFQKDIDPVINHVKLFVVFEDDNSVIQYLPNDYNKIGISKEKRVKIIAVLSQNQLAVVENEDIKKQLAMNNKNIYLATNKVAAQNYFLKFDFAAK